MNVIHASSRPFRIAALLVAVLVALAPARSPVLAVPPMPDLIIIGLLLKESDGGAKFDVKFSVKNQGTADAKNVDVAVNVGPMTVATKHADRVDKGHEKSFELKIDSPAGNSTLAIVADPANKVAELNDNNNSASISLQAHPADLTIDHVQIEQTNKSDPQVKVTIRVKNKGKGAASGLTVKAWQPEIPDTVWNLRFDDNGKPLANGQTRESSFTATPFGNPVNFKAKLIPDPGVSDSNPNDKDGSAHLTLQVASKKPDLVVQLNKLELDASTSDPNGKLLGVYFAILNIGGKDVTTPVVVKFHFVKGGIPDFEDPIMPNGIAAGKVTDWVHPQELGTSFKDYYGTQVVVTLDPNNTIDEGSKANNSATGAIPRPLTKPPTGNPMPPGGLKQ